MAPKIDLSKYAETTEEQYEIWEWLNRGCCLDTALKMAGKKQSNYKPCATGIPRQPLLYEERIIKELEHYRSGWCVEIKTVE